MAVIGDETVSCVVIAIVTANDLNTTAAAVSTVTGIAATVFLFLFAGTSASY